MGGKIEGTLKLRWEVEKEGVVMERLVLSLDFVLTDGGGVWAFGKTSSGEAPGQAAELRETTKLDVLDVLTWQCLDVLFRFMCLNM